MRDLRGEYGELSDDRKPDMVQKIWAERMFSAARMSLLQDTSDR